MNCKSWGFLFPAPTCIIFISILKSLVLLHQLYASIELKRGRQVYNVDAYKTKRTFNGIRVLKENYKNEPAKSRKNYANRSTLFTKQFLSFTGISLAVFYGIFLFYGFNVEKLLALKVQRGYKFTAFYLSAHDIV